MSQKRIQLCQLVVACLTVVGLTALAPAAAAAQQGQVRNEIVNSTADGRPIHITYFPADPKSGGAENAPVVVLLHGKGGDRIVWIQKGAGNTGKSFADVLQDQGYAVVTVDLRKHGESKTADEQDPTLRPNDYTAMIGDLEAVKNFLLTEHQDKKLNISKMGIIAADDMCPVAATFAQLDWQKTPYDDAPVTDPAARTPRGQDVRALVMLSPSQTAGSMNILGPMKLLRDPRIGMAVLVIYGTQDPDDKGVSKRVFQNMAGNPKNKDRVLLKDYEVKFRGTDLTAKSILVEVPILQFLDQNLLKLDVEWRDRRSRINR